MPLTAAQLDRAVGAILGSAAGDALGASYEFGPPLPDDATVEMRGGGTFNWAPGEWTDDTSMAIPILREVAAGSDLNDAATQDRIVAAWTEWAETAPDVGIQTRNVLGGLDARTADAARRSAQRVHDATGRSGGNGSLMRTGPVALAYLDDRDGLVRAARGVSELTHVDTDAGDACVLWSLAIRHAILTGELDITVGLGDVDAKWTGLLATAVTKRPREFEANGWVVEALQSAWSAICAGDGLVDILERAVRGGRDTDTVAAIAGALAGAVHGASAVPDAWGDILHGWPGLRGADLEALATSAVGGMLAS
jgi:ADP-ribosyl-[dinitrogen reductase] hydrolase